MYSWKKKKKGKTKVTTYVLLSLGRKVFRIFRPCSIESYLAAGEYKRLLAAVTLLSRNKFRGSLPRDGSRPCADTERFSLRTKAPREDPPAPRAAPVPAPRRYLRKGERPLRVKLFERTRYTRLYRIYCICLDEYTYSFVAFSPSSLGFH